MQYRSVLAGSLNVFLLLYVVRESRCRVLEQNDEDSIFIRMPGVSPTVKDEYFCYATQIDVDETFLKKVETRGDKSIIHHASIGFCEGLSVDETVWSCASMNTSLCSGPSVAVGGWDNFAENDGDFEFPEDVGIEIGRNTPMKYLVFQVHYREPVAGPVKSGANVTLRVTQKTPKYRYQIFALALRGYIPAKMPNGFFAETACIWRGKPGLAYSYVIHTHNYGVMVEGYLIRNKRWILLGSHLSIGKEKHRYNVTGGSIQMQDGDIVAARCLYINKEAHNVTFGHSIDKEMCNFMIDFAYDPAGPDVYDRTVSCDEVSPSFSFCDHTETAGIC